MMGGSVPRNWIEYSERYIVSASPVSVKVVCDCFLQCDVEFTTNIDITSYHDGKRETHNVDGRAIPQVVWDLFEVSFVWLTCSHKLSCEYGFFLGRLLRALAQSSDLL